MKWTSFPDPRQASEEGIVALGGELTVDLLVSAYAQGIFPWPHEDYPMLWFCPWERGILEFKDLHIPRSLQKLDRKGKWQYTVDQAFEQVIQACAEVPRPGQNGTWITAEILDAYLKLHRAGYAHSLEVWEEGELVGGIYGVFVKNVFSAESMFYRRSNASKWAVWKLVNFLKKKGLSWIDVQMVTDVMQNLGAKKIPQDKFLLMVCESQRNQPIVW